MSVVKIDMELHTLIRHAAGQAGVPVTKMVHHLVQEGLKVVQREGYFRTIRAYSSGTQTALSKHHVSTDFDEKPAI